MTTRRIVHVTFGLDTGGQEKLLVEFARHADRQRFEPVVVSIGNGGALASEVEACGCEVIALGQPTGLRPGLVPRLARLFQRLRPAVVHTHDARALFYAGPAARLVRVPFLVHTCHGLDTRATPRQNWTFVALSRLVDRYVCVSNVVLRQCRDLGVRESGMCSILNGIDLSRFSYSGPDAQGPLICVARLNTEKNLSCLVQAVALAAREAPIVVEVAGDGPCLGELQEEARLRGIADRVRFLGAVREVEALLRRARGFVLSSLSEGIPLSILEAMARGLPVIATRVGGVPEVVVEDQTGILVPAADPAALAEGMLRLWRDPELGRQMGRAGRNRAEGRFDVRRMVLEYEALYEAGKGGAPSSRGLGGC